MAVALEEITPELGTEYQSVVGGGGAPGRPSLERARANLAARNRPSAPPPATTSTSDRAPGGRSGPARAAVEHRTGQLWVAGKGAGRLLPTSFGGVQMGGRSSLLPRLIAAGFLGLLVLEVVSTMTGRYFSYSLSRPLQPAGSGTYRPLYPGQQIAQPAPFAGGTAAGASAAAAAGNAAGAGGAVIGAGVLSALNGVLGGLGIPLPTSSAPATSSSGGAGGTLMP